MRRMRHRPMIRRCQTLRRTAKLRSPGTPHWARHEKSALPLPAARFGRRGARGCRSGSRRNARSAGRLRRSGARCAASGANGRSTHSFRRRGSERHRLPGSRRRQPPTVVLFVGLPGNEKNLDLAQAVRRTPRQLADEVRSHAGEWPLDRLRQARCSANEHRSFVLRSPYRARECRDRLAAGASIGAVARRRE